MPKEAWISSSIEVHAELAVEYTSACKTAHEASCRSFLPENPEIAQCTPLGSFELSVALKHKQKKTAHQEITT